jgi:hypothetical protein
MLIRVRYNRRVTCERQNVGRHTLLWSVQVKPDSPLTIQYLKKEAVQDCKLAIDKCITNPPTRLRGTGLVRV